MTLRLRASESHQDGTKYHTEQKQLGLTTRSELRQVGRPPSAWFQKSQQRKVQTLLRKKSKTSMKLARLRTTRRWDPAFITNLPTSAGLLYLTISRLLNCSLTSATTTMLASHLIRLPTKVESALLVPQAQSMITRFPSLTAKGRRSLDYQSAIHIVSFVKSML